MSGEKLWEAFVREKHPAGGLYTAWAFGMEADRLAQLVLSGEKTATASAYPLYEWEREPLPTAGEYSVILDAKDQAVCVIRTNRVSVIPFHAVPAEHAFKEGEGDRSLAAWRETHEKFFTEELKRAGLEFSPDMKVVCEEFEVVYRP